MHFYERLQVQSLFCSLGRTGPPEIIYLYKQAEKIEQLNLNCSQGWQPDTNASQAT